MEKLFSDAELAGIYERSLAFSPEEAPGEREAFVRKARKVLAAFAFREEAPLFGRAETGFPNRLMFAPLFGFIKESFGAENWRDAFCPGAFSGWEDAFLSSLEQLFGSPVFALLEEEAGEMTFPSDAWYREKALPAVKSGRHFKRLAQKYPLCARQLIEFTWLQAEHVKELLEAVREELPALYGRFFPGRAFSRAVAVSASDSDRHNGGRSVHVLTFEDGNRLVYKPHALMTDRAFARWVNLWAGKAGIKPFPFPVCEDTERGGFCGFVEHAPLQKKEDAAVYFYRTGFLLGLVALLNGNDLHCENILAAGEDPVFIDTETLLQPPGCLARRVRRSAPRFSVTEMGVLPILLSFPGLRQSPYAGLCRAMPGSHNLPEWEGKQLTGRAWAKEISEGFEKAVEAVTKDIPAAAREFEKYFSNTRIRSVIRPTAVYGRLLNGLCHRNCQEDPAQYRALFDRLRIVSEEIPARDRERICHEEEAAFGRLDIPLFAETLTKEMLRELSASWHTIEKTAVTREKEKLFFGLKKTDPGMGTEEKAKVSNAPGSLKELALAGVKRQTDLLFALLSGGGGTPAVVTREQDDYTVSEALRENNGLLEGSLGVIVALSAAGTVLGEEGLLLKKKLEPFMEQLTDPARVAPVLTGSDLSLTGGAAGYLLGCRLCFRLGTLGEDRFRKAVTLLDLVAEREDRLRYSEPGCLYGCDGMLYALSLLPETYRTAGTEKIRACLLGNMKEPEEEICARVRADMLRAGKDAVKNNGLRFGNAGALLRGTEEPAFENSPREAALVCALAAAEHVLPGEPWPEGYLETGLFHGLPGVTYSLCRFLVPEAVPGL